MSGVSRSRHPTRKRPRNKPRLEPSGAYLTQPEVAAELRISISTLRRRMRAHKAPKHVKVGRKLLWRRETIDDWMKRGERQ